MEKILNHLKMRSQEIKAQCQEEDMKSVDHRCNNMELVRKIQTSQQVS